MKTAAIIVRVLMGLMFAFASVTYFLKWMPQQPVPPVAVQTFMKGVMASVYLMPLVKVIELSCAIAFLTGRFVALAAVMIFPIIINILLFHAYLEPSGLPVAIPLLAGDLFLLYINRDKYRPMLAAK